MEFVHNEINPCELWHKRYDHLHYRALLALKQMVSGIINVQVEHEEVCKGCALGKNVKNIFLSNESRSKEILDLTLSYVCGPMLVKSLAGSLYYVAFIDDFSRKTWIYFMKTKDEVFDKFREFKVEVENLKGKKIKILRSYNGGEYTSEEIVSICQEVEIKRELIFPYNLQQNGVVERKN